MTKTHPLLCPPLQEESGRIWGIEIYLIFVDWDLVLLKVPPAIP
jgi:hypothetical protein